MEDASNGALLWNQAMAAINSTVETPLQSTLEYCDYPPYPAKWHEYLDRGIASNTKSIALARRARQLPGIDWKIVLSRPLFNALTTGLNQARDLANVLSDSALHVARVTNEMAAP